MSGSSPGGAGCRNFNCINQSIFIVFMDKMNVCVLNWGTS